MQAITVKKRVSYRAMADFIKTQGESIPLSEIEARAKSYANSLKVDQGEIDEATLTYLARIDRKHGSKAAQEKFEQVCQDFKVDATRQYIRSLLALSPATPTELAKIVNEKFHVNINARHIQDIKKRIENGTLSGKAVASYVQKKQVEISWEQTLSMRKFFRSMYEKYVFTFLPTCDKVKEGEHGLEFVNVNFEGEEPTGKTNEVPENEAIPSVKKIRGSSFHLVTVKTFKAINRENVVYCDKRGLAKVLESKSGKKIVNGGKFIQGSLVTFIISLFDKHKRDIPEDKTLFFSQDGKMFKSFNKFIQRFGLFDIINDASLAVWYEMVQAKVNKEKNWNEEQWLERMKYHLWHAFYVRLGSAQRLDSLEVGVEHSDFVALEEGRELNTHEQYENEMQLARAYVPLIGTGEEAFEEAFEGNSLPVGFPAKEMRKQKQHWLDSIKEEIALDIVGQYA